MDNLHEQITNKLGEHLSYGALNVLFRQLGNLKEKVVDQLTPDEKRHCLSIMQLTIKTYADKLKVDLLTREIASLLKVTYVSDNTNDKNCFSDLDANLSHKEQVDIENTQDVVKARMAAKDMAGRLGFSNTDSVKIATAVSEISRNINFYAGSGTIEIATCKSVSKIGIKIVATDNGPGIKNIEEVFEANYTSAQGLGMGLKGVKALMDEFDIETSPDRGTKVTFVKWL